MSLGNSLLAKIEKVNNVVVGLGTNLVGNIIMFLTTIYITNNVTEQVYGEFRLTFALISILVLALMLGRDSSVLYFYQKEQKDSVIFEEAMSGLLLIAVGCIILYIFDGFFIRTLLSNQVSKDSYHLSLLMIPLWAAYNLLTPVVRLKGFVNSSFILSNLLQRFLRFPFLVIFIVLGYNGFAGLAWSMILSQILLLGILIYYLSSVVEWTSPSIKSFVKRFGYALSLGVNSIMLAIAGKIDVLILGKLSSVVDVAIYDIVTSLAIVCLFPYIALSKSFEPKLYQYFNHQEKHDSYRLNLSLAMTLTTLGGLFFIIFSREILALFGKEYVRGDYAFLLVSVSYILISCWGAVSEWMTMNGYAKYNLAFLLLSAMINITLCYMLIPLYGLTGAALALGIGLFISRMMAFIFIMFKGPVLKLVAGPFELIRIVFCIAIAIYFRDQAFLIKSGIYCITGLAFILSDPKIRNYILKRIKNKKVAA
ncbi:lipopolysaccharide biosynthesis protein [Enterobacter cloacae]|uniref:lipopolysaccharide biosynthesis protein n=1 Tax=Enterobacter cloacae TaxID=550 RepID=UPI0035A68AA5